MGCRNKKKLGKKSSVFSAAQIGVIKDFNAFGINILKHKVIHGIMVSTNEDLETGDIIENVIGLISVPVDKISYEDDVVDNASGKRYGVIGDKTYIVDEKFDLEIVGASEESLEDKFGLMSMLQEAVENGLCSYDKEFDIIYLERFDEKPKEDVDNDIDER